LEVDNLPIPRPPKTHSTPAHQVSSQSAIWSWVIPLEDSTNLSSPFSGGEWQYCRPKFSESGRATYIKCNAGL